MLSSYHRYSVGTCLFIRLLYSDSLPIRAQPIELDPYESLLQAVIGTTDDTKLDRKV